MNHVHKNGDWHSGSLIDCSETVWCDAMTVDGKPARLAEGMSVQEPPDSNYKRYRDAQAWAQVMHITIPR